MYEGVHTCHLDVKSQTTPPFSAVSIRSALLHSCVLFVPQTTLQLTENTMVDKSCSEPSLSSAKRSESTGSTTVEDEGSYIIPPQFPPFDPVDQTQKNTNVDIDDSHRAQTFKVSDLETKSKSELLELLLDSERKLKLWRNAASDFFSALALSPEMTDSVYSRTLRELLTNALQSLDTVDSLQHVLCSMPSLKKEAPTINLVRWDGLKFSEWDVSWAPTSWWVSVSADGSRWGLAFNCLARVSDIHLNGRMQCSLSNDLTAVRTRFSIPPNIRLDVATSVGWGVVPVPVQQSIAQLIRSQIERFVDSRLCSDEGMVIVLRRKYPLKLSENDINEAAAQARSASSVRLRGASLF